MRARVNPDDLINLRRKKEQMVRDLRGNEMVQGMRQATLLVVRSAKEGAPRDTGRLVNSIQPDINIRGSSIVGVVGSNVDYAPYMEMGTGVFAGGGRHFPPPAALDVWARRHGFDNGFQVALAIYKRGGLRPRKFLENAIVQNESQIVAIIGDVVWTITGK